MAKCSQLLNIPVEIARDANEDRELPEPCFYCTLESSEPWFYGTLGSSDLIGTPGFSEPRVPIESEEGFTAGRMVPRLFFESHDTLLAVSAPLVMPLRDSDIQMNAPFTLRNKNLSPRAQLEVRVGREPRAS